MRHICAAVTLITVLASSFAQALTTDRVFELAVSGQIDQLETELNVLDIAVRQGEVSYDAQREIYDLFQTTHPDVVQTIQVWRVRKPDSRHALAASMWHNYHAGFMLRGSRLARYTHPRAIAAMEERHQLALKAADSLLRDHPDFVPGTDGTLRLMLTVGDRSKIDEVLLRILEHSPNAGSLERALFAFQGKWGGGWSQLARICHDFAPMVPGDEAELCMARAVLDYEVRNPFGRATANRVMADRGHEFAPIYRMLHAIENGDANAAMRYFPEAEIDDYWVIRRLYHVVGPERRVMKAFSDFEEKEALKLPRDPLNPELLIMHAHMNGGLFTWQMQEAADRMRQDMAAHLEARGLTQKEARSGSHPDVAQWLQDRMQQFNDEKDRAEEVRRARNEELLKDAKTYGLYNPDVLSSGATTRYRRDDPTTFPARIQGLREMMVYSRYEPDRVGLYLSEVSSMSGRISRMVENGTASSLEGINPIALRDELACESVRAARITNHVCRRTRSCNKEMTTDNASRILAEARDGNICPANLNARIGDLLLDRLVE